MRTSIFWGASLLALSIPLPGVEIRVASFNVQLGLDSPESESYQNAKAIIERISPDILSLQEISNNDRAGSPSNFSTFARELSYPHVFIPDQGIDSFNRVVILSRHPFLSTASITSPENARDLTRTMPAVIVDVPYTENDPLVIGLHLKCCLDPEDPFRRAVEMRRVRNFLERGNYDGTDNIIITGDLNLIGEATQFTEVPPELPAIFQLGADIQDELAGGTPLLYSPDPVSYFPDLAISNPPLRQQNGSDRWTHCSRSVLDFMLISDALDSRGAQFEIYNSALDSAFAGLIKEGPPLPSTISQAASDHLAIFGDFELDEGASLELALSIAALTENGETATLTVSLPEAASENITITLSTSDASEAILSSPTLTIPAGQISASTSVIPRRDRIIDGNQNLFLGASSTGFRGAKIAFEIIDIDDVIYSLSGPNEPLVETFDGFEGMTAPAAWRVSNEHWRGIDDGNSMLSGPRSYGNGSLGIFSGEEITLDAQFRNDTGEILTSLEISYDAQQWRASQTSTADRLSALLLSDGLEIPLPTLTFVSPHTLSDGPLHPPIHSPKSALVTGLNIPTGETFTLRFFSTPGMSTHAGSSEVFINEFHYDNISTDEGEFLEIAIGPAFTGELSSVELVLYNGRTGTPYDTTRSLDQFMPGATTSLGYQLHYLEIDRIQNGNPGGDGFALVINDTVTQFLSYEGSFTASLGPAAGMTTIDIGVEQSTQTPSGRESLSLTGMGTNAADFTWAIAPGTHTPGQINDGQEFITPSSPQGIAIDQLLVTANPLPIIVPQPIISAVSETSISIVIPTQLGQNYELESSHDLMTWKSEATHAGNDAIWRSHFNRMNAQFYRVRATRSFLGGETQ